MLNVLNYISAQRQKINSRHQGETYFYGAGCKISPVRCAEQVRRTPADILAEINAMRGLNVEERAAACGHDRTFAF